MDVRIGVTYSPKELEVLLADDTDPEAVRDHIDAAITAGGTLWLNDRRGRQVGVPVDKVGSPDSASAAAAERRLAAA